jgi:hypothetical protein
MMEAILMLIWIALAIWIIWKVFVIVGDMAEKRGQDRFLRQVTAVFINPISAMLLLWIFCRVKPGWHNR